MAVLYNKSDLPDAFPAEKLEGMVREASSRISILSHFVSPCFSCNLDQCRSVCGSFVVPFVLRTPYLWLIRNTRFTSV